VQRLDSLLFEKQLFPSREKAKRAVMAGLIEVDGRLVDKPGTAVSGDSRLEVRGTREPYVSRAGRKLAAALEYFDLDPHSAVCLDIGASTGGFCDCLLQKGARRIYAVDVGYGQLDQRLREDSRVIVMERVNARYLERQAIADEIDLITIDVSFISLTKIVPAVLPMLQQDGRVLPLIKPQFEAGKGKVGKGGIVRDPEFRQQIVRETVVALEAAGLESLGCFDSPVIGTKGNREAFALFRRGDSQ
jgi:23S rRNA (cytidine1920-2'-O)/16S rRNA (cytidine1409-2'-O)-methyltransferase